MKIIVDTDAFISLLIADDSNHKIVLELFLSNKKAVLYISPITIGEAVTVISNRLSQREAKVVLSELRKKNIIELDVTSYIKLMTDKIFLEQRKKHTSWFDCLNVALYRHYNMDAIFSFDKFYKRLGLNVLK